MSMNDNDGLDTSRSSRSSSPATPVDGEGDTYAPLTHDAFKFLNDPNTWIAPIDDSPFDTDLNAWSTLGQNPVADDIRQFAFSPMFNAPSFDHPALIEPIPTSSQDTVAWLPVATSSVSFQSSTAASACPASSVASPQPHLEISPAQIAGYSVPISYSEFDHPVVNLPRESCSNLSIQFPNIPSSGVKSRVETQVRVHIDLTDREATSSLSSCGLNSYNRVGSWSWLRLPLGSSTRRRPRKDTKIDAKIEDTLYLSTEITCASPPHLRVSACSSCQNRESKRTARKLAARVRPSRAEDEEMLPPPPTIPDHADTSGIVQFNCAEILEFSRGSYSLPVRITCYCRHHREKTGFRLKLTLSDHTGRCVGYGTTPPIMITDDHKTFSRSALSTEAETEQIQNPGQARGVNAQTRPKRQAKAKPYDVRRPSQSNHESPGPHQDASVLWHGLPSPILSTSNPSSPSPSLADPVVRLSPLLSVKPEPCTSSSSSPSQFTELPTDHIFPIITKASIDVPTVQTQLPMQDVSLKSDLPQIHRLIPSSGPTYGGIEITILGSNFSQNRNLSVLFGEGRSIVTQRWSDNTLVCLLPARSMAGSVPVTLEDIPHSTPPLFTYIDDGDRALMELALQVVGLKMTGKIEDAKNVAMRIVGGGVNDDPANLSMQGSVMDISQNYNSGGLESELLKLFQIFDLDGHSSTKIALMHTTSSKHTLLHLATLCQFSSLMSFLLSRGLNPNARDSNGLTALHFASSAAWQDGINLLLQAGADPAIVDGMGRNAEEMSGSELVTFSRRMLHPGHVEHLESSLDSDLDAGDEHGTMLRSRRSSRVSSFSSLAKPLAFTSSSPEPIGSTSQSPTEKAEIPMDTNDLINWSNWFKESIIHLQSGTVPTVPWQLLQFPQLNQIPQLSNLPIPHIPYLPDMQSLTNRQLVYIAIPSWPSFPWPQALGGEKSETLGVSTEETDKRDASSAWRAALEKWLTQVVQSIPQNPITSDPPPGYSKLAETSLQPVTTEKAQSADIPGEKRPNTNQRQCVPRRRQGMDRMLFCFWLPTMIFGCLWVAFTSIPMMYSTLRDVLTYPTTGV